MNLKSEIEAIKLMEKALTDLGLGQDRIFEDVKKVRGDGGDVTQLVKKHQIGAQLAHLTVTELIARKSRVVAAYEILGDKELPPEDLESLQLWANPVGKVVVDKGKLVLRDSNVQRLLLESVEKLDKKSCEAWADKVLKV